MLGAKDLGIEHVYLTNGDAAYLLKTRMMATAVVTMTSLLSFLQEEGAP